MYSVIQKTNGCIHIMIYTIDSQNCVRKSDKQLIINLTKRFGKVIWDHAVVALTKADRFNDEENVNLDALRDEFKEVVFKVLKEAEVSQETLHTIPFALTTNNDHFIPPECEQGGENEIREWYWKDQLFLYMLERVETCATIPLMELHPSTIAKLLREHPYAVTTLGVAGGVTLSAACVAAGGYFGLHVGAYAASAMGYTLRSRPGLATALATMGLGGEVGSRAWGAVSRKLKDWMKIKKEQ